MMMRPMRENISLDEAMQLNKQKIIHISFTNKAKPWCDPMFTIKAYEGWKADLEGLLSAKDNMILPIMIPTKVRCPPRLQCMVMQLWVC
jgi:hypothetical protein